MCALPSIILHRKSTTRTTRNIVVLLTFIWLYCNRSREFYQSSYVWSTAPHSAQATWLSICTVHTQCDFVTETVLVLLYNQRHQTSSNRWRILVLNFPIQKGTAHCSICNEFDDAHRSGWYVSKGKRETPNSRICIETPPKRLIWVLVAQFS